MKLTKTQKLFLEAAHRLLAGTGERMKTVADIRARMVEDLKHQKKSLAHLYQRPRIHFGAKRLPDALSIEQVTRYATEINARIALLERYIHELDRDS